MTEVGMKKIRTAKKNGMWTKINRQTIISKIPRELEKKISNNKTLKDSWDKLAPSHKKQYLYWISEAKRIQTKERRISKTVEMILKGKKPGLF